MKDDLRKSKLNLKDDAAILFEGIVDTIHEPLIILNDNLRVVTANNSFYKYFDVNLSETEGNLIYDLGNKQWDIPALRSLLEDILPDSSIINDFEVNHRFENIGEKTLLLNARRLDVKDRDPLILVSIYDITKRKKIEEHVKELLEKEHHLSEELKNTNDELLTTMKELRITNEELINVQEELHEIVEKLEISNRELEQFAYVASHDLQEPLRMVSSFTQLLEKKYKDNLDMDANDYIEFIVEGAQRMKDLIDDLLMFSRLNTTPLKMEFTQLNKIFDMVLSDLRNYINENNAQITRETLPIICCDSIQIRQLFQNLISNAIKFNNNGTPKIHISAQEYVNGWLFRVSDNGIGISPENQKKIFNIFNRLHTREEYQGTGIGLAICKKIVERHNGKIWVESEPEKGSTFYFTIPEQKKE